MHFYFSGLPSIESLIHIVILLITQLEEEYRRKAAALTERERSLSESVKLEFESVQRETYQQRQQLLQQSEQLRQRENEVREQKEHYSR